MQRQTGERGLQPASMLEMPSDGCGGSKPQSEAREGLLAGFCLAGRRRHLRWHCAELEIRRLLFASAHVADADLRAGLQAANLAGEIASVVDSRTIDRRDDVTGLLSGFGGGRAGLGIIDQRAFGLLEIDAVGDVPCDGLRAHAQDSRARRCRAPSADRGRSEPSRMELQSRFGPLRRSRAPVSARLITRTTVPPRALPALVQIYTN